MDFSTINLVLLRALLRYTLPRTYRLQESPGNGCFLDAPGYPTYFTRNIYTQNGNTPRNSPQLVIEHEGVLYIVQGKGDTYKQAQRLLRRLWLPLAPHHPRVILWHKSVYKHLAHCYKDVAQTVKPLEHGKPATLIWPIPNYEMPRDAHPHALNDMRALYATMCTPENHAAVRAIREFYPDHQPDQGLICDPPKGGVPGWYETDAEQPLPENCKPRLPNSWGADGRHPVNRTWCQWCGWQESDSSQDVRS